MKRLIYLLRSYFGFSRTETNGFFILITLITLSLVAPLFYDHLFRKEEAFIDYALLDSLSLLLEQRNAGSAESILASEKKRPYKQFRFDPNKATHKDFEELGIPSYIANRIINYRHAGGKFVVKSDLLKIYGFSDSIYHILYTSIDLPEKVLPEKTYSEKSTQVKKSFHQEKKYTTELIDINTADSLILMKIKGIGPVLSARIIKYRDALGGFVSSEQFHEVYGLLPQVVETLRERTYISDDFSPRKININKEGVQNIARHPYISLPKAKVIYNFRQQHGNYASINDLKQIKLLTDDEILKLEPYIGF